MIVPANEVSECQLGSWNKRCLENEVKEHVDHEKETTVF